MPQEDDSASKLNHPEEIFWVAFPANDDATIIMEPGKQTLDFPATTIAPQRAAVLSEGLLRCEAVRRDHPHRVLHHVDPADRCRRLYRRSVVRVVRQESLLERGFDERGFIRRSADHVHGERKTMAVCDCHDFAAFAAFCRADSRAPFSPN